MDLVFVDLDPSEVELEYELLYDPEDELLYDPEAPELVCAEVFLFAALEGAVLPEDSAWEEDPNVSNTLVFTASEALDPLDAAPT